MEIEKKPDLPGRNRRGLVLVFTGNGKGKTSAALGILMRAWGHGMRAVMLSFIKATDRKYGEHRAVERMDGIEIIQLGDGFTWLSENLEKDRALAQECWQRCLEKLSDPEIAIVVLDEITYPVTYGWLDVGEVVRALGARPPHQHVVITGRDAHERLVEIADTVSEMREVKHAFTQGIPAALGLEL